MTCDELKLFRFNKCVLYLERILQDLYPLLCKFLANLVFLFFYLYIKIICCSEDSFMLQDTSGERLREVFGGIPQI
jgi:hypothetical protein